jgi:hypothetical protein
VAAAAQRVFPAQSGVEVYLTGGLMSAGSLLIGPLSGALRERHPRFRVRESTTSPLDGVALLARDPGAAGWFPAGILSRSRP